MRLAFVLSVLVCLLVQDNITCVRIRDLRVPAHVAEGSEVVLGCIFDMQGHRLFSVKWLRNGEVFYHYRPGSGSYNVPDIRAFSDQGVSVDVSRSSMETVTLLFMGRESAGEYRCDVTGEGPLFRKDSAKKNITVDLIPEKEPEVTGLQDYYDVGSPVLLNCTSTGARPASRVQWFVNNMQAPKYHVRGPWYRRSLHRLDAYDTTVELSFGVRESHFLNGIMKLKCEATLAPLYRKEVELKYQRFPRTRGSILMATTTKYLEKTTEEPCTDTITVELDEPPPHLEPWSIEAKPDGATLSGFSVKLLYVCILLRVLL